MAAVALITVKMSGCVAAAIAFAGLNKELDANRSLDLMRTLGKTLLTRCAELVTGLNSLFTQRRGWGGGEGGRLLGICNLHEHMIV